MHFSLIILYTISAEERWQRGKGPKKVLVLYGWYRASAFYSNRKELSTSVSSLRFCSARNERLER
jgi:hypothetical protein